MVEKSVLDARIADLGGMDIYLIDQIQKGRIVPGTRVLDAGFGSGRNLELFVKSNTAVYGIERDAAAVASVRKRVRQWNPAYPVDRFIEGTVEHMPYDDGSFDFVGSIAVLHFADGHAHFNAMLHEMLRVLAPGGFLLIRMTGWHTFTLQPRTADGLVHIADGRRYMLDIEELKELCAHNGLILVDPAKTVNVDGMRTMSTVVLRKG